MTWQLKKLKQKLKNDLLFNNRLSDAEEMKEARELVAGIDNSEKPELFDALVEARSKGLITLPLIILVACFNDDKFTGGKFKFGNFVYKLVCSGNDIVDVMTYQMKYVRSKPLPMQLRKCMKNALEEVGDYLLSSGLENKSNSVSLADCVKLLHPHSVRHASFGNYEGFFKDIIEGKARPYLGDKNLSYYFKHYAKNSVQSPSAVAECIHNTNCIDFLNSIVELEERGLLSNPVVQGAILVNYPPDKVAGIGVSSFTLYNLIAKCYKCYTWVHSFLVEMLEACVKNVQVPKERCAIMIENRDCTSLVRGKVVNVREMAILYGVLYMKRLKADVFMYGSSCKKIPYMKYKNMKVYDIVQEITKTKTEKSNCPDTAFEEISVYAGLNNVVWFGTSENYEYKGNIPDLVKVKLPYGGKKVDMMEYVEKSSFNKVLFVDLHSNKCRVIDSTISKLRFVMGFTPYIADILNEE